MKHFFFTLLFLAISISSFGHVSKKIRAHLNAWVGHTSHELVEVSGPLVRSVSDENGGKILVWCSTKYFDGTAYYHYLMFYADSRGVIYRWRTSTELVPPAYIRIAE